MTVSEEIPVEVRQRASVNAAGVAARLGASQADLAEVLGALGLLTLDETLRATERLAHTTDLRNARGAVSVAVRG